jgi:hypothetical protein
MKGNPMKICTKCNRELPLEMFYFDRGKHISKCKLCNKEYRIQNADRIHAYSKKYHETNTTAEHKREHKYRKTHAEEIRKQRNEYYHTHIEKRIAKRNSSKKYYDNNKYKIQGRGRLNRDKIATRDRLRRREDPQYKISSNLRRRLRGILKGKIKNGSSVRDLGCSMVELKKYLEGKFLPGMRWENYGTNGWHIDHVIPLTKFNLEDRTQFLIACHHTNLQPMWANDNRSKSNMSILDYRNGMF